MKRKYKVGIIPGDGIGRDVIKAAMIVLDGVNDAAEEFALEFVSMVAGDAAVEKYGNPFPKETFEGIKQTNAVLFGAAGGLEASNVINGFRRGFDLYANVRPIKALPGTKALHPHTDLIVVRENTEGLYRRVGYIDGDTYVNLRVFTRKGMERILRFCFKFAQNEGRKKVTFTHKSETLFYTDKPMKEMFYQIAKEFPAIEAEDMSVDNCAMQIVMKPEKFDVILAESANGDILSDVGAGVIGGLGLVPGGNIGDSMAIFEPAHGSAPKYADKNIANPIAAILATKMMINYLGETAMALQIEESVKNVLLEGKVRTFDLGGTSSTTEFGEAIAEKIHKRHRNK
jgi:isocitrate/isopropylmalate dehydrogenase